jgi:hypothetical protein
MTGSDKVAIACLAAAAAAIGFVGVNSWQDNQIANEPFIVTSFSPAPVFPPGALPPTRQVPRPHKAGPKRDF